MTLGSFPDGFHALVVGASRGIGLALIEQLLGVPSCHRIVATCRHPEAAEALGALLDSANGRLRILAMDVTSERSVALAAESLRAHESRLHLVLNAAGVLHEDGQLRPERRLEDLREASLQRSFAVNALGPMLLARHTVPLMLHGAPCAFTSLSARVGSISDNRLGGWYGYRASKAAQNQFIRTLGVEMARRAPLMRVLALHPGTVDTQLSKPFQAGVAPEKLFDPRRAAAQLLQVIDAAQPTRGGRFLAWDGAEIPW